MIEVLLVIFIILTIALAIALNRSVNRIAFYVDIYGDMYSQLSELGDNIRTVLSKEIYSNDPVIQSFVRQLQEIEVFLRQVEDRYRFNTLGEDVDESR
jgi:hypothetical protein